MSLDQVYEAASSSSDGKENFVKGVIISYPDEISK